MLKDPFLNESFQPDLMWFVGVFDVYDREETLGAELEVYDPNDPGDRVELIKKYSLDLSYLSYRHKYLLVECLANKLNDQSYEFENLFDIDEEFTASWPRGEWYELDSPRGFFQDIYTLAQVEWKDDLHKASLEDQSTW
ncbi:hypothetical protein [Pseudomonas purpurea]|uniref:hypothetical protein n=1 Tax=Pseudomonas purpurea TaxID=3136737 RepID=UPI003262D301